MFLPVPTGRFGINQTCSEFSASLIAQNKHHFILAEAHANFLDVCPHRISIA
jgi:hypothetical protein